MVNVLAVLVAVAALVVAVLALRRVDVVERRARRWAQAGGQAPGEQVAELPRGERRDIEQRLQTLERSAAASGISRVAVVRYDAFEDVGGRMSFSVALLDAEGRGVVITGIHGRSETRSYVKEVPVAPDARELSPEESQAIAQAMRAARV